jgi:hypothetical protein
MVVENAVGLVEAHARNDRVEISPCCVPVVVAVDTNARCWRATKRGSMVCCRRLVVVLVRNGVARRLLLLLLLLPQTQ